MLVVLDRLVIDRIFQPIVIFTGLTGVELARLCSETAIFSIISMGVLLAFRDTKFLPLLIIGSIGITLKVWFSHVLEQISRFPNQFPNPAQKSLFSIRLAGLCLVLLQTMQMILTPSRATFYLLIFNLLWVCAGYFASTAQRRDHQPGR